MSVRLVGTILLTAVEMACAHPAPSTVPVASQDLAILALVRQALEQDALEGATDSLYLPTALVIANGTERTRSPRLAGVGRGGRVRIAGLTGQVDVGKAWAVAKYRWIAPDGTATENARATFLLELTDGRWHIRHVHSSITLPWDPGR